MRVRYYTDEIVTVVVLPGSYGVSIVHPDDVYDEDIGILVALLNMRSGRCLDPQVWSTMKWLGWGQPIVEARFAEIPDAVIGKALWAARRYGEALKGTGGRAGDAALNLAKILRDEWSEELYLRSLVDG